MQKTKKILAVLLVGTMLFSFTSCKEKDVELKSVTLNNASIEEYTIVYSEKDIYSKYCAENLADLLLDKANQELKVVSDGVAEVEYEILIGNTNRDESQGLTDISLQENQYIFSADNDKIVMYANGYMVGGAANHLVNELILPAQKGNTSNVTCSKNMEPFTYQFKKAENVILMIGDGMGDNHIAAALQENAINEFCAANMPNKATVTTYSYSVYEGSEKYTDSAAAATALATGYKTKNAFLGMDYNLEQRKNVRELAYEKGANTAVLTTDEITGATPAGFIVHGLGRSMTEEIQAQIDEALNNKSLTVAEGSLDEYLRPKTAETLYKISQDGAKFFAMIEEGWIDKHSHDKYKDGMIGTLVRFNDTIAYVMEFVLMHPDTVLMVTADHETGGLTLNEEQIYTYTTGNHTNTDVSVFSMGYGTEVMTNKTIDNIDIPKFIAGIYGEQIYGGESLK